LITTNSALSGARCTDVTGFGVPEHHGSAAIAAHRLGDHLGDSIQAKGGRESGDSKDRLALLAKGEDVSGGLHRPMTRGDYNRRMPFLNK
jgi:hypothetical protein